MQGFIVLDYASEFAEARKQLAEWLSEGKIKRKETVVKGGSRTLRLRLIAYLRARTLVSQLRGDGGI